MLTKYLFILCSLSIPHLSFSQVDFIDEVSNWLGDWTGSYTVNEWNNKESLSVKFIHNNHWIQMDIFGKTNDDPDRNYSETILLTADNDMNVHGFYIDNNGFDGMAMLTGKVENNELILSGDGKTGNVKITWKRKGDRLFRTTSGMSNGKEITVQTVFNKKT